LRETKELISKFQEKNQNQQQKLEFYFGSSNVANEDSLIDLLFSSQDKV